jgi:hypothetical protein
LIKYNWRHEKSFILNQYGWIRTSSSSDNKPQSDSSVFTNGVTDMAGVETVGSDLEVQPVEVGSSENGLTSAIEDGETEEKNGSLSNGTKDDLPAVMRDRSFSD